MISRPTADTRLWLNHHDVASSAGTHSRDQAAQWALPPWAVHATGETATALVHNLVRWNDARPDDRRAMVGQLGLRWPSWRTLIVEVWDNGNPRCSPAWPEYGAWATYRYFSMARLRVR
ncbi:hypothetical protein [Nocardia miyunensis]|uniref:hypothetical protein n=1 Tax=Nocardia miyunensis TaxID=282684 RepID=UPI0009FF85A5|nr:hypothetical protein [Nocardia miyunensis]